MLPRFFAFLSADLGDMARGRAVFARASTRRDFAIGFEGELDCDGELDTEAAPAEEGGGRRGGWAAEVCLAG